MNLEIHTVRIRGTPLYTCSVCGAIGHGSTVGLELTSAEPEAIAAAIRNVPMSHIPVGWACYGRDVVKCPAHVT